MNYQDQDLPDKKYHIQIGDVFCSTDNPTLNDKIHFYQITKIKNNSIFAIEINNVSTENENVFSAIPLIGKSYSKELEVFFQSEKLIIPNNGTATKLGAKILTIDGIPFKIYDITHINLKSVKSVK